jgi:hypothetical protein
MNLRSPDPLSPQKKFCGGAQRDGLASVVCVRAAGVVLVDTENGRSLHYADGAASPLGSSVVRRAAVAPPAGLVGVAAGWLC